jgi:hypothetical protein
LTTWPLPRFSMCRLRRKPTEGRGARGSRCKVQRGRAGSTATATHFGNERLHLCPTRRCAGPGRGEPARLRADPVEDLCTSADRAGGVRSRAAAATVQSRALTDLTTLSPDFLMGRPTLAAFLDRLRERHMLPEPKGLPQLASADHRPGRGRCPQGHYQRNVGIAGGQTYRVSGPAAPRGRSRIPVRGYQRRGHHDQSIPGRDRAWPVDHRHDGRGDGGVFRPRRGEGDEHGL